MNKRLLFTIALCCFFNFSSNGQAFQWAKQFKSPYSQATDIVTDNNLNVISVGFFSDTIDMDPGPNSFWRYSFGTSNNYDAYISKLDVNGSFVWGYSYNATESRIHSVDVDDQDNIIVLGIFSDSIDLDFGIGTLWLYGTSSTSNNFFVAKYNPNGVLLWGRHFVNATVNGGGLSGHMLEVDFNNDVIVSGNFRDTVDFDPGLNIYNVISDSSLSSALNSDKFLLKLDGNGNFVWVRHWPNSSWNFASGAHGLNELAVDSNNNIFLQLNYNDSLDVDPQLAVNMVYSQGLQDVSLLKMTPTGSLVWHKELGGVGHEHSHSLVTDRWGNIFYNIQSDSKPFDADPGPGQHLITTPVNAWARIILKLDNNGDFIWALENIQNNYSNYETERMVTDTLGGLYLTSLIDPFTNQFNQWDLDPGPGAYIVSSAGHSDIAFQNLDSSGNFIWGGVMGGSSVDFAAGLCADNARGVYMTGLFDQMADFDPTPATTYLTSTPTGLDAFVVKLKNCNKTTSQILQDCDSIIYNSQVYYNDTILQYHYPAFNGCDSAHAIIIDIENYNDTIAVQACDTYVWDSTIYTISGLYPFQYQSVNGCDSLVTLDLTINSQSSQTIQVNSCNDTTINNTLYTTTGNYVQQYLNQGGCDSTLTINFTKNSVDTAVSYVGNTGLVASAILATYQWIDCGTMQIIQGATAVTFTATQTGTYACAVTQNGCTDTSACYPITVVPDAVTDYSILSRLYPNPSTGLYQLELDKKYQNVQLEVRTINGQLIWQKQYDQLQETTIDIDKASGVYMLYIKQGGRTQVKKLMKW